MSTHAILSPSGSAGWLACPGKPAMERGLPDEASEYADGGTCAHALAALCFAENQDPAAYLHRRLDVGNCKTWEVDEEMVGKVRIYINAVRDRIATYKLAGATSVELLVEQRVPIGHITGEEGAEGTADVVLIVLWPDGTAHIVVIDLKYGVGVEVSAVKNPQGMLYALGAVEKFSAVTDFEHVVIAIHQPRIAESSSDWELSMTELQQFAVLLTTGASIARGVYEGEHDLAGHLHAGEHCRKTFCRARATCPELARYVQESVGADFEVISKDPATTAGGLAEALVLTDPTALSLKMKSIEVIEDWSKAVRARVEGILLAGGPVPGYKLVQGRQGNRAWTSAEEAEAVFKSMRLKLDEMYDFSLISPTTAEKRLKDQPKRWKRIEPLITRAPGKPSVAPESDKRPALSLAPVADAFEVVGTADDLV